MTEPIDIAVVGHTNAGKTSLLRTLLRRPDFGEVSEQPGTTRHVEAIELRIDGAPAVRFHDTPGLEDSTTLLELLQAQGLQQRPPERIRAFVQTPAAAGAFEQEAKVLRTMLAIDAAFYVIDTREPVLPKHRSELEILSWCARPVLPVLNFVRDAASREADWSQALAEHGLHAVARFDAVAPFAGAELRLYRVLATLLRGREAELAELCEVLELQRLDRRMAIHHAVADMLVAVAAARHTVRRQDLADPVQRDRIVEAFRARVVARAQRGIDAVLQIHAFTTTEARLEVMPWLDGRWAADLFNPEALQRAGRALGTGALVGASVGVVADLALAGLSLGTGAAIGAAIGGAASQGFGAVGRVLGQRLRGQVDLSVEDTVLAALAERLLTLMLTLEQRGHAAASDLVLQGAPDDTAQPRFRPLLATLAKARAHPEWATDGAPQRPGRARRARLVEEVVAALRPLFNQRQPPTERPS